MAKKAKIKRKGRNKKTPKVFDDEIKAIKKSRADSKVDLFNKSIEAKRLVDSEIIDLLSILSLQSIDSSGFKIKDSSTNIVFKISFNRAELLKQPEANKALANIKGYTQSAELDTFKEDK